MAQSKIVIVVGEHRVASELLAADGHLKVVSSCGDRKMTHPLTVLPRVGYSNEQMEYDIEVFRHEKAAELAGKVHVGGMLAVAIEEVGDQVPEVSAGPRFKKPEPPQITDS